MVLLYLERHASTATIRGTISGLGRRANPAIAVALGIVTILSVQGFGFLLPGELRMYREMRSANPDPSIIAAIGKQNAMLGGVQGVFQLLLILDMAYLRYGGFPF
jgi:hypothetical protein